MHGNITDKKAEQTATKAAPPDASKKTDSFALPHITGGYALRSGMSIWSCAPQHSGSCFFYAMYTKPNLIF